MLDGGSGIVDILKKNLQKPHSIAVVPTNYLLFWTDVGDQPAIHRSGLDGSQRKVLFSKSIFRPTGIAIDIVKKRLYWMDVRMHSITSCDFDGSNLDALQIASDRLVHPWSLSVFEDTVYWSDWAQTHSTIFSANKLRGGEVQSHAVVNMVRSLDLSDDRKHNIIIHSSFQQHTPLNLRVFHQLAQPSHENICLQREIPCSHMCLVTTDLKTKCLCPRNFIKNDENTCINSKSNHSKNLVNYNEDETTEINLQFLIIIISASIITVLIIILVRGN